MMQAKPIFKRSIFLFLVFTLIHFSGLAQNTAASYRMKTVVIDAGHGGKDPGNLGTGRYKSREKDIALDVALRVGGYIRTQFPEINVIYTRSTDVFIGLDGRTEVANDAKADLFISIHCNAFTNPESNGVETFVLGLHRNKENLQVAMKENSAIFLEDDYKTKYEGFDPNSAESIIALTIMQSAYLQQSLSISSYIQQQFKSRVGRRDRGVKQAGFLVLRKTTMPSILVELGFLTNPVEEDFLNSENGKSYMSSAIFRGFKEYKELVEDPLPEGYVEPKAETVIEAPLKADEQKVNLNAKIDSLEALRLVKIAAFKEKEKELSEQKAQELVEQKAKKASDRKAQEEKDRKELEAKENAKEWLEDIKEVKEQELAEAKQNAATDAEKERLLAIKTKKEEELAKAKRLIGEELQSERSESLAARKLITEQARIDSLAKAKLAQEKAKEDGASLAAAKKQAIADSLSTVLLAHQAMQYELEKVKEAEIREQKLQDSVKLSKLKQVQLEKDGIRQKASQQAKQKAAQDSISILRRATADSIALTIDDKQAGSTEEAELLFLQLRKRQLEQRIAKLKGRNIEVVIEKKLEERAVSNPVLVSEVDATLIVGLRLKIQVLTSAKQLEKDSPNLRGQKAWEYQQGGLYKYTVGDTQDFEEITKLQSELRGLGFKGAFVVAFKDGERIKVSEAREMLNK
jgi:N-acetylmuramoyl-L-alanine amidase